ncbi:hypothetical protein RIF29_20833 [Crotalaria pallida]|uniref:Protein FAR1-RELATED SEQUENCE n=1 Tax=Crotalaria pallida TaxID=3830 RepID=A0AAN9F3D0_CROPI
MESTAMGHHIAIGLTSLPVRGSLEDKIINSTMDVNNNPDMNKIHRHFDLNELPMEETGSENDLLDRSENIRNFEEMHIISSGQNVEENQFLEVNKIENSEIDSSIVVEHINFEEEVDEGINSTETNIVPFVAAFRWLIKTFVSLMKKAVTTILTDKDPWMKEAISKELSSTKHSFCIWHITFKFSSWFNAILRQKYAKWCADFYDLYKLEAREEFEHKWPEVVAKYNLQSNKHVKGLYEIRDYWTLAYLRAHFFGGMTTTGQSESINAFVKRFINSHTSLRDFTKLVDLAIDDIKQKEEHDIMLEKCTRIFLKLVSPLQEQAHSVLTQFAFHKFQEEFEISILYSIQHENGNVFVLQYYKDKNSRKHEVFWDDCHEIPSNYLPRRWKLQASHDTYQAEIQQNLYNEEQVFGDCNNELCSDEVVRCSPISKTKGRLKRRRCKGGKELM